MFLSPALQQFSMSQQASPLWLVFCGGFRVSPAAEIAKAAPQARLIKSTLIFLIVVFSKFKELRAQFGKNAVMTVNELPTVESGRHTSRSERHNREGRFVFDLVAAAA